MSTAGGSRHPGFYEMSIAERLRLISASAGLEPDSLRALSGEDGLRLDQADQMIENVIGVLKIPLGLAVNFLINGREVLIPMAIEEPSVVAGASYMAKIVRQSGGFIAQADPSEMIGQIQLLDVPDLDAAKSEIMRHREELLQVANESDSTLANLGAGARDLEVRTLEDTPAGPMLIVHLIMDTLDAMGANAVNTAAEAISPIIERVTGGRVHLRILSNLADRRLARASCSIPPAALAFSDYEGAQVRDGIIEAWAFAAADPYRAATHNKGIMNGIDALLIATANDWRAAEAGAHAYAARSGGYKPLSNWWQADDGSLQGELELPLAVGVIGGATRVHPTAKACLKLMGVQSAHELAEISVSLGLAQNLAALRALATEGIQRGHMSLHARQVAIAAGAEGDTVHRVAKQMINEEAVGLERAKEIMSKLEDSKPNSGRGT